LTFLQPLFVKALFANFVAFCYLEKIGYWIFYRSIGIKILFASHSTGKEHEDDVWNTCRLKNTKKQQSM
jgi:hypothetical protein